MSTTAGPHGPPTYKAAQSTDAGDPPASDGPASGAKADDKASGAKTSGAKDEAYRARPKSSSTTNAGPHGPPSVSTAAGPHGPPDH